MDVMFTTGDGPGKHYMVVASGEEWAGVLEDLLEASTRFALRPETKQLIHDLEGWAI